ncbi:MAG: energy-coupling factor transporter transmembrane protein EcfT [Lachnospiraceae bacterium]|nr:energy-coupling factor transporter transmembrane protein EcfT [Lachnospiraceae bacterium]
MADIYKAGKEFREMDDLAMQESPIHAFSPTAKLLITIAYIFIVASFNKYSLSGLMIMALYPAIMFSLSGISVIKCFYKLRFILPIVMAVGIFNPFYDRVPVFTVFGLTINAGFISMLTLMLKGILCLMASFILASTTSIDKICIALRKIHMPKMMVTLILLMFRYISVMIDEVSVMYMAYSLRAPLQKGVQFSAWGSFLGQLLLRSSDKAQELYLSMQLRGFDGEFEYAGKERISGKDILITVFAIGVFILFRVFNISQILGGLFV